MDKQKQYLLGVLLVLLLMLTAMVCLMIFFQPVSWVVEPSLVVNPSGKVPLSALVKAKTEKSTRLVIEVQDGDNKRVIISKQKSTQHSVPVLNFKSDKKYTLRVREQRVFGKSVELEFVTPPLPNNFPPITTKTSVPEKMEDGITLFSVSRWNVKKADTEYGLIVGVDEVGEVVWYYINREKAIESDVEVLENGNISFTTWHGNVLEMDKLGNVIREWHPENSKEKVTETTVEVEANTFHHELSEMPNGNFLALSSVFRQVNGYPANGEVVDDVVVEFSKDGKVQGRWSLLDMLDPLRVSYDSFGYYGKPSPHDWGHANSVYYVEEDDSFIVSLRHQDAVVKFNRAGELKWILGDHEGWKESWSKYLLEPIGDTQWSYHQHAAKIISNGNLLLYDNGNNRAISPLPGLSAEQSYSRAVEYKINEENMTVEQVWSYGGEDSEQFYSPFLGDADELKETSNVLITDGGRINDKSGLQTNIIVMGNHWARLVEVTKDDMVEKVFELIIGNPDRRANGGGWSVYRSERVKGFFDN